MRELKPAAWRKKYSGDKKWRYEETGYIGDWDVVERLYTAEQLHPHVKMTQAQFDEFEKLSESGVDTIYDAFDLVYSDRGETDEFENIYNRLFGGDDFIKIQKNQLEFSNLWTYYNPEEPEETIEIVPDMKWFVRSKKVVKVVGENNYYAWLFDNDYLDVPEYMISDVIPPLAMIFDTKEEAGEWKNPLTEAVLLPVEGN